MSTDAENVARLIVAEAAAAELTTGYKKVARATAFIHHREKVVMLSVEVTDYSVMEELPRSDDGKYKGFEIVWGFYIPQGTILQ